MTKEQELLQMAARIRELWPNVEKITLEVIPYFTGVDFYHLDDYHTGTELLRELGIGERDKAIFDVGTSPWCTLRGTSLEGLHATAFCGGLPPSCHIEEYIEKVPVCETITKDEFVEVRRKKVICG
jgi:hypothetical protein